MLAYGYGIICANNLLSTLIGHCNVFSQQCFDHCYEHSIGFMLHFHLLSISLNGWLPVSVYDKFPSNPKSLTFLEYAPDI